MKALLALDQAFFDTGTLKKHKTQEKTQTKQEKNSTLVKQFLFLPKAKTQEKKLIVKTAYFLSVYHFHQHNISKLVDFEEQVK